MTIGNLVLYIGINAIILTLVIAFLLKKSKATWMTFLQSFCGALFLFSGWVKAVDPLGTAYKMEQYFDEFYYTFTDTSFGFLAPLFPLLSSYAVGFSVFMIVFELILGINLLTGAYRKFTAWAFFLLTAFFTVLTGFTYLTGYVPSGTNFFSFGQWGPYAESNMRVTDCGCFGDFIKLKPKVSFLKDVFLLIPAILFLVFTTKMHQLFSPGIRRSAMAIFGVISLVYCWSNYVWDIPHVDFRPFKENANVREQYAAEQEASGNVQVVAWKIQHPEDNKVVELSNDVFMKEWGSKYKSEGWEVVEQVKSEPTIPLTKISDFEFTDADGFPVSEDFLNYKGATLMMVSYKLKGDYAERKVEVQDSIFSTDTIQIDGSDSVEIVRSLDSVVTREANEGYYVWESSFEENYKNKIAPLVMDAKADGVQAMVLIGGAGQEKISRFAEDMGLDIPMYEADDILLKTIVRSNPGLVLWKDGTIIKKWHIKKNPTWAEVKKYLE
jgi:uncharacterized membrane protein YphA (DoxX/SURF4 family)